MGISRKFQHTLTFLGSLPPNTKFQPVLIHTFVSAILRSMVLRLKKLDVAKMEGASSALSNEVSDLSCWDLVEQTTNFPSALCQTSSKQHWLEMIALLDELDRTVTTPTPQVVERHYRRALVTISSSCAFLNAKLAE